MPGPKTQTDRIFSLLQETGGFVSSQEICRRTGISRAAVWKQIETLRKQGFSIEGVSSVGYRLSGIPDALHVLEMMPASDSARIGKRIIVKEETGSTNNDAWDLGEKGEEEGVAVLAESQHAGKGRRGRQWISPPGKNLYLSILLRPLLLPSEAPIITIMAAVSLCETIEALYSLEPRIKWPNDILLEGKKVSGILAELHAEQESIHFLILGIGVNLNMDRKMIPGDLLYPATSVALCLGRDVERVPFARRLMENLDRGYEELLKGDDSLIRRRWMESCAHPDASLEVNTPKGVLCGRFKGIDQEGAMLLETERSHTERIRAGDVIKVSSQSRQKKQRR